MFKYLLLLFVFANQAFAQDAPKEVLIELQTGLQQKALLVGIQGDTVILGGRVNGQQTIVRLHKDRIKSIRNLADSTQIEFQAPALAPEAPIAEEQEEIPPPHDWLGHMLLLPPDTKGLDSNFVKTILPIMLELLREKSGFPVLIPDPVELDSLTTPESLLLKMKKVGAIGMIGSFWQATGDSLHVQFKTIRIGKDSTTTTTAARGTRGAWAHWLLSGDPWKALEKAAGVNFNLSPISTSKFARIWVETDPDSAWISVNGNPPTCKSPCRVLLPTQQGSQTKASIWASWRLDSRLWAGKTVLNAEAGDSLNVNLKLQPSHATLQITSHPSGAEIYPTVEAWSPSLRSIGHTPFVTDDFGPGEVSWLITYPGYQDTVLRLNPDPTGRDMFHINLIPLKDLSLLEIQNSQLQAKRRLHLGKAIVGVSIAPTLVGGVLLWLSTKDFNRAERLKHDLEQPSTGSGPQYADAIAENRQAVNEGQHKILLGSGLVALGVILASVGISLWF